MMLNSTRLGRVFKIRPLPPLSGARGASDHGGEAIIDIGGESGGDQLGEDVGPVSPVIPASATAWPPGATTLQLIPYPQLVPKLPFVAETRIELPPDSLPPHQGSPGAHRWGWTIVMLLTPRQKEPAASDSLSAT